MTNPHTTPSIVVGIDGSAAARDAAIWASAGAAARSVTLLLVYVVYAAELLGEWRQAHDEAESLTTAQAALDEARDAVKARGAPCDLRTEILQGNPLATLIELSETALMVCVGSVGAEHRCHRAGSTAAALAGSARCPVAIIHPVVHADDTSAPRTAGDVVAEVRLDGGAALRMAMTEARLRGAAVRAVASCGSHADDSARVRARLDRRISQYARRYPGVRVIPVAVDGEVTDYLAGQADSIQLFVSDTHDRRTLGWADPTEGYSVLTLGETPR